MREKSSQRASCTIGIGFAAVNLAGLDDESVEFVEQLMLVRKARFKEGAQFFVRRFGVGEAVAFENAAGVSINHEHRMFAGVQEDGIGCFRPDAAKSEQLVANSFRRHREEALKRTAVF